MTMSFVSSIISSVDLGLLKKYCSLSLNGDNYYDTSKTTKFALDDRPVTHHISPKCQWVAE